MRGFFVDAPNVTGRRAGALSAGFAGCTGADSAGDAEVGAVDVIPVILLATSDNPGSE